MAPLASDAYPYKMLFMSLDHQSNDNHCANGMHAVPLQRNGSRLIGIHTVV